MIKTKHTETPNFRELDWAIPGTDGPLVWRIKDTVYFICTESVLKFFAVPVREYLKEKNYRFEGVTTLSFIDTSEVSFEPHDPLFGFGVFIRKTPEQYDFSNGMLTCLRSKERLHWDYSNRKYRGVAIRIIANKYSKDHMAAKENFIRELNEGKEMCFSSISSSEYFFPVGKCTVVVAVVNSVPWFESDVCSVIKRDGKRIPTRPEAMCGCDELFVSKESILKYTFMEVDCDDCHPYSGYSNIDQNNCIFNAVASYLAA